MYILHNTCTYYTKHAHIHAHVYIHTGESYILASPQEYTSTLALLHAPIPPLRSCLASAFSRSDVRCGSGTGAGAGTGGGGSGAPPVAEAARAEEDGTRGVGPGVGRRGGGGGGFYSYSSDTVEGPRAPRSRVNSDRKRMSAGSYTSSSALKIKLESHAASRS